jgi:2,3-bisphosphoglycerate-dependent phosphoglycerate mutase
MTGPADVRSTLAPLDVLLIRHAEPIPLGTGDVADDDRPLTEGGRAAAAELAVELDEYQITAVYSSPYARSLETVSPIAQRRGLEIQLLDDLRERRLSPDPIDDWLGTLQRAWSDSDFAPPGGETGRAAQRRAVGILDLLRSRPPTAAGWFSAATATSSA